MRQNKRQSRVKRRMVTVTAVNQHLSDVFICSMLQFLHHSFISHILGCTLMKRVSHLLAHMTSSSSDVILRLPRCNVLRERGGKINHQMAAKAGFRASEPMAARPQSSTGVSCVLQRHTAVLRVRRGGRGARGGFFSAPVICLFHTKV